MPNAALTATTAPYAKIPIAIIEVLPWLFLLRGGRISTRDTMHFVYVDSLDPSTVHFDKDVSNVC